MNDAPMPRHLYDCGHCKFSWCCGPLCACMPPHWKLPPAPYGRGVEVERMQSAWRRQLRTVSFFPRGATE